MRHLTPADYRRMPWSNGRGTTVEMLRIDSPHGLLLRLSIAHVTEDGPFSVFPGIERNLTVIAGPGFRLEGEVLLDCLPLRPVAFPGDAMVQAVGTGGVASDDFNVMSERGLGRPQVFVANEGQPLPGQGTICLLALGPCVINGAAAMHQDLVITEGDVTLTGPGSLIGVRFAGTVAQAAG